MTAIDSLSVGLRWTRAVRYVQRARAMKPARSVPTTTTTKSRGARTTELSRHELESMHSWDATDEVPGRPEMTAFRRMVRLHQARWRERHGHPIGTQPLAPRPGQRSRPVGSHMPVDYARRVGANFVTEGALVAAKRRLAMIEPNQSIDHQRMWADLSWAPVIAFNLLGDLASDRRRADSAIHTWWPSAPGRVQEILFAHSPGWLDPTYLNSLRVFDAMVILDLPGGGHGVIAIDTKYRDWTKPETPRPENRWRYEEVAERSGIFRPGAVDRLKVRSGLAVMWLEHLLLLSMLQHPSGRWRWGIYVVLHPEGNADFVEACARYSDLLRDGSTFASTTLEEVLASSALLRTTRTILRERYVPRARP